jgi:hypothetical protein
MQDFSREKNESKSAINTRVYSSLSLRVVTYPTLKDREKKRIRRIMGRHPLNKDAKIATAQQQGKKIDRRRKEFRNLPKPKKRKPNYGPPSHILKARIDPKFEEMRRRREEEGGVLLGGGGGGLTTTTTTSSGGGEEEKRGEEEEEEAWREADVVAKKKQQQQQQSATATTTATTSLEKHATMNEEEVKNEEKKAAMIVVGTASNNARSNHNDNNEDAAAPSLLRERKREALRKEEEEIERQKKDDAKWRPVCLSRPTMAKGIELMDDGRMVASSQKGYRCVQGTRGVEPAVVREEEEEDEDEGAKEEKATTTTTMARYFEVKIEHLGESGCVRVGWMTKRGEMNAPVGFDNKGYGYHAETGSKYHEARLKRYGDPYGVGDVVGCYLYLDEKIVKKKEQVEAKETSGGEGARGDDAKKKQTPSTPERNKKNRKEEERLKAKALEESQNPPNEGKIAFYKNGKFQGIAFESLRSCAHPKKPELSGYFPTAALYTTPLQDQSQRARVSFNFGPDFAFPIDAEKDGLPKCSGFSPDLDPPKPPPSPPPALEKAERGEGALALESSEGVVKTEEGKEEKQSTSRSDGERGSPRARSKDEACGVPEKQPPESKEEKEEKKEEVKKEKDADVVMKEEEEEVNDDEKVKATSEEAKEKEEQTKVKQEAKEEEVQEFGKLSAAVEPASFSRGGEDGPEPARGLDAFVVEANVSPVPKEEEEEEEEEDAGEAQKQEPPETAETATTTRDDDNQLFSENMDVETNDNNANEEDDGNIGYNWLSG